MHILREKMPGYEIVVLHWNERCDRKRKFIDARTVYLVNKLKSTTRMEFCWLVGWLAVVGAGALNVSRFFFIHAYICMNDACRGCNNVFGAHWTEREESNKRKETKSNHDCVQQTKRAANQCNNIDRVKEKKTKSIYSMLFECVELYLMCSS